VDSSRVFVTLLDVSKTVISPQLVSHVAKLSNLTLSENQEQTFPQAFSDTLAVIDQLKELDIKKTEPTHQVTGLENVLRDDVVREDLMFTQAQALANATQTHDGFIVVPQIIDQAD
jgi:aspartyl-tRNA(Asn)/glutamyl-tRNA(Gln) amidotransferase subunit C